MGDEALGCACACVSVKVMSTRKRFMPSHVHTEERSFKRRHAQVLEKLLGAGEVF